MELERATFAGGCFWCLEEAFSKVEGVVEVIPGYAGGTVEDPTYEEVCTGETGHVEAVQVLFDRRKISYRKLLITFWISIDPTDAKGQFFDRGSQYRTVIFYHDEEQKRLAEKSKRILEESGLFTEPVVTEIRPFYSFYPAEEFHHRYFERNPLEYFYYKRGSGRETYCRVVWKEKGGRKILEEKL